MARAAAAKLLGTRKFQLHRAVGSHSEDSADVFEQDLLLDAKTTADARLDDANPAWGQADNRRDNTADVVGNLRAGAHHKAIIFVPVGDDDMIFDGGLLHLWNDVLAFDHQVRFGEATLHVTNFGVKVRRDVAGSIVDTI